MATITCLVCGYDLRSLPKGNCPECGRRFDPEDPDTVGHPVERMKPWLLVLATAGVSLAILWPIAAYVWSLKSALHSFDIERGSESFDSDEWKRQGTLGDTYRWSALDDLIVKHNLIGMSKDEIIALLGEPDRGPLGSSHELDYYLAPQFPVDDYWFILELDEDGFVTRTYENMD